jgi:pyridoxamine 5'-phosphate oxidase
MLRIGYNLLVIRCWNESLLNIRKKLSLNTHSSLEALRLKYGKEGLAHNNLHPDPLLQFQAWYQQAIDSGMAEPNGMCLATATASAAPSLRTVLMKSYDENGFVFYTNFGSRKAKQITENNQVSLIFPWISLHRQVIIEGRAEKISTAESLKYFSTRPRGNKLGAWSSHQSEVLSTRAMLEAQLEQMKNKFANREIPLPSFWGGYRVKPAHIEFWQGRQHRLHDRFLFTLTGKGAWKAERLAP